MSQPRIRRVQRVALPAVYRQLEDDGFRLCIELAIDENEPWDGTETWVTGDSSEYLDSHLDAAEEQQLVEQVNRWRQRHNLPVLESHVFCTHSERYFGDNPDDLVQLHIS